MAQEAELKERQRQAAEEEERMKSDEEHNRDSALLPFDYSSYRSSSQISGLDEALTSPDSILDSDSSLLSPVPGSTLWEEEESVVVLNKGSQGLGFSILDFVVRILYFLYVLHFLCDVCLYTHNYNMYDNILLSLVCQTCKHLPQ